VGIARGLIGIGIPYVFGGKSLLGMDCSGFVWEVLKRAGYNVPYRNSAALKAWATPITAAQAQPGDLVFWPGHVAIYVSPGIVIDNGTSAGPKQTKIWGSPTYGRIPI
jgi:cell wall-associated NlpC family hydrolase